MSQAVVHQLDRFERVDKFEVRRAELADATLETLGELGFARTSLREIARKTAYSHGLLHYYFRDKVELITYCVRRYKEHCVTRYDEIVATATTPDDLAALFAEALVATLLEDTATHRLWYDVRSQAMFEGELRATVADLDRQLEAMVWRVVSRHAELAAGSVAVPSPPAYAVFEGLCANRLGRHRGGAAGAAERLRGDAVWLIGTLVRP